MTPPTNIRRQVRKVEQGRLAYYLETANAEFWDNHWAGSLTRGAYSEAEQGRLGWFEEPFMRYLPRTGKILEAGCGIGQHVVALRVRGYEVTGVEWAQQTVHAARVIFPTLPVESGDVTALNVPDGYYAGYVSLGVMEHRKEGAEPFLREAFRVVAPGGVAMISVPHFHPLRRIKGLMGFYGGEPEDLGFYQYAYGVREFSKLINQAGFEIVDRYGYDGVKGLKDEISWLRHLLAHERYGPRVRSALARWTFAERRFGHMMLFVCRKPAAKAHSSTPNPPPAQPVEAATPTRLALLFTRGMSLREWDVTGMLGREMALYQKLQEHGIEVTMVTYGGPEDLHYATQYPGIRILSNHMRLPLEQYEQAIERIHEESLRRIDVFKTNQTNGADVALRVAEHFGRPLIARCGYMWSAFAERGEGPASPGAQHAHMVEANVFAHAALIVVTTAEMARDVSTRFPDLHNKIRIVPNYVDTQRFSPLKGIPFQWTALFIGRLVPQKNLTALLDAIVSLPVRLGIIGQGPLEASLRMHPSAIMGKVEWLGRVASEELPGYLRRSQIFILPSIYEGHPKALLEAMSIGLPCIGSDVAGINSVLTHEKNGLLCPPTPEGLRVAVQRLLNDPALAARLGEAARKEVEATCALDRIVEKEMQILQDLKSGSGREASGQTGSPVTIPELLEALSNAEAVDQIGAYIADRARRQQPDEGLRMLFKLEDLLYAAEGELSVKYGNGVHTKHRHTRYHDFFVDRIHKGESVLDVGCGVGAVAHDIATRSAAQVIGVDLNARNIAVARRMHDHPNVKYIEGDALRLESTGPIDVVVLSNVLEHIAGRPSFLRKLIALGHPSRFLIRVPLFERDWRIPLRKELGVEYRLDPTHETEYTLDSFAAEMDEAGLSVTHLEVHWGEIWAECAPVGAPAAPRVSVIMSTHNDAKYLPLAMESILQQTFADFECIIINDASMDDTAEILHRYPDPRIRVVHHERNVGLTRSLNEALALCRGAYVARMDGDDIALPDRFTKQVAFLDEHLEVGLVGTAFMYIDGDSAVTGSEPVFVTDEEIRSRLLKHNCFGHGTVMVRRALLQAVGGYDESFRFSQDYDLWLRIAERAAVANIADKLYCWRRTSQAISSQHTEEQEAYASRARKNAIARGIIRPVPAGDTAAIAGGRHD
jgi:glycosyltransferase involved in cell wall biosynthesis/2-polyprenyl-3-methyl-5-hydroxy-6-metoxy-1,4-benzoquinol methylase